ncbi:MAG: hypothetical protein ACSHX3_13895 [Litorimonas sp.]
MPAIALAQNTSGPIGPTVKGDDTSIAYRASVNTDTGDWAQRFHIQKAISESLRGRVVLRTQKIAPSKHKFDYVQGELLWQVTDDQASFQTGFRLDGRYRGGGRPGQIDLHFANQWSLSETIRMRASLLSSFQLGENRNPHTKFQVRGSVSRRQNDQPRIGAEYFFDLGTSDDFRFFEKTSKTSVGPFVDLPVSDRKSVRMSALVGLTQATPDLELRVFVSQSFR